MKGNKKTITDAIENKQSEVSELNFFVDGASQIQLNPYVAKIHFIETLPGDINKPVVSITIPLGDMFDLIHKLLVATSHEGFQSTVSETYQELLSNLPKTNKEDSDTE